MRYSDRPLPPYAFVPGTNPHPTRDPRGHSYGPAEAAIHVPPERWREDGDYLYGVDLYEAGFFWEAHEAWEGIWKASPEPVQRDFLQGLIQLAAARLKARMGEEPGCGKLLDAARRRLERVAQRHDRFMGIELAKLLRANDDVPRLQPR